MSPSRRPESAIALAQPAQHNQARHTRPVETAKKTARAVRIQAWSSSPLLGPQPNAGAMRRSRATEQPFGIEPAGFLRVGPWVQYWADYQRGSGVHRFDRILGRSQNIGPVAMSTIRPKPARVGPPLSAIR